MKVVVETWNTTSLGLAYRLSMKVDLKYAVGLIALKAKRAEGGITIWL